MKMLHLQCVSFLRASPGFRYYAPVRHCKILGRRSDLKSNDIRSRLDMDDDGRMQVPQRGRNCSLVALARSKWIQVQSGMAMRQ